MTSLAPGAFRFGQKLTVVLLLACVSGFVWAMLERRPWEQQNEPGPVVRDKPVQPETPLLPEPRTPDPEPEPYPTPEGETPVTNPSAPSEVSKSELDTLFRKVREMLSKAEYDAAAEELEKINVVRIPQKERRNTLRGWKSRTRIYQELVRETKEGRIIPMPEMTRMELKNGGKIICRTLSRDGEHFTLEDIRGIRTTIPKVQVVRVKILDPDTAFWEVWEKLKSIAAGSGILARDQKEGNQYVFRFEIQKGRSVSGGKFFALADFCISNGMNQLVTTLLDEALNQDRNLLKTVHEKKGARLVSLLFYFMSVPSPADAEILLQKVLQPHYSDTQAFRDKVKNDTESRDLLSKILKRAVKLEPDTEAPPPTHSPDPETKPATEEKLPNTTPEKIQKTVLEGDRLYKKAMEHLLESDPSKNPGNWGKENKKALELFRKAAKAFATAQEAYSENEKIPQALMNRFRETQIRLSLCRKRALSTR